MLEKSISCRRLFVSGASLAFMVAALAAFLPSSGFAAEKEKEKATGNPLSVEVPGLVMPVARGDNLTNYLFAVVRVEVGDSGSADFLRQKPFLVRDAVVKISSKSPVIAGAERGGYDTASLVRIVDRAIKAIRPGIVIRRIDVERGAMMR
jgi:hypothetical protein